MSGSYFDIGTPGDDRARGRTVAEIREDFEGQDREVLLSEASDIAGAVVHWFGCRDGDAAFGSLVVDKLREVAEFVHSQPCTCPPGARWNEDACGRCRALTLVADDPEPEGWWSPTALNGRGGK